MRVDLPETAWRKSSHSGTADSDCVELALLWRRSSHSDGSGTQCVELAAVGRKSSHSGNADSDCIELAATWRTSSHSGSSGGECVEVAALPTLIAARDSKHPTGAVLTFTEAAWRRFTRALKRD